MKISHIVSIVLFLIALRPTSAPAQSCCVTPEIETTLADASVSKFNPESAAYDTSWLPGSDDPAMAEVSDRTRSVGGDNVLGRHNEEEPQTAGQENLEQSPASPVVAVVGGASIHEDDLDRYIGHDIDALKEKLYALRKQALESMIDSFLLRREAARLKATESDLLKDRLKIPGVPAADVDREWANNYEALRPMGEVMGRYRILLDLQSHARTEAFRAYLAELRQKNDVKVFLEKPEPRLRVRTGAGTLGSASAPSELVVFLDYECPFCRKLHPELRSLLAEEPLRSAIRVTVKQFPLSIHHNAFDAALSAVCAEEQHKFAAMHELLLTSQDIRKENLLAMASKAGLEPNAFQQCLSSERASSEVLRDLEEGNKSGVQGTPALFLDGQPIELPDNPADLGKRLTQSMRKTEQSAAVSKNKEHGK